VIWRCTGGVLSRSPVQSHPADRWTVWIQPTAARQSWTSDARDVPQDW